MPCATPADGFGHRQVWNGRVFALGQNTLEIKNIRAELDALRSRLKDLNDDAPAVEVDSGESSPSAASSHSSDGSGGDAAFRAPAIGVSEAALLRTGVADLTAMSKLKDFPEYFARIAKETGLRLLLLKRWNSGLQVYLEQNIKLPAEAKRKRSDGRAPIPTKTGDIFESVGQEATVYAGPVPLKHFPLDLTLLLGRGSRDRQIIILPLPSQNHWNTFIYIDADHSTTNVLFAVELLAHYALARMCLLQKGVRSQQGRVVSILKAEMYRRKKAAEQRHASGAPGRDGDDAASSEPVTTAEAEAVVAPLIPQAADKTRVQPSEEIDPFAAAPSTDAKQIPLAPPQSLQEQLAADSFTLSTSAQDDAEGTAAALPDWTEVTATEVLTPEMILHHSGELPALPKAACHIMAVIEDPRTTATRLEKALAMDQTLTAKVLRIANSPFYGAVREIRTVSEAIVRLGFVTIRNWTLVTATRSVFLSPGAGMLYQNIWRQSVLSAMAGQLVGQAVGRVEPENIFIGGLMQNIGQLVLARSHPELFQEILNESTERSLPYHEIERLRLGFDHGELGALLIREWNLSEDLEDAVRWHHNFQADDARNARIAAMIALGEEIAMCSAGSAAESDEAKSSAGEDDEATDDLPPLSDAASFLGVSQGRMADLKEQAARLHIDPHFFS